MNIRRFSPLDRFISEADKALRTVAARAQHAARPSPAVGIDDSDDPLTEAERRHAAGLMRVNHSGEVCAQALYQGQALTAKLEQTRAEMEDAAAEEVDHLAWCEQRLSDLGSRPSHLNPLWYAMSFGIGAGAGLISDKISLGFVAATEEQVCRHLQSHLLDLPAKDHKSRAVVEQMIVDEQQHGETALAAGGARFPAPVKASMRLVSKLMTHSSYRF